MSKGYSNVLDELDESQLSDDRKNDVIDSTLDEIDGMSENSGVSVVGKIYRITSPLDAVIGRPTTELVGKVDQFVDEDFVGRNYGPGRYKLRFRIRKDGVKGAQERNVMFTIGPEYAKYVKPEESPVISALKAAAAPQAPATSETTSNPFGAFFGAITAEKIAVVAAAVEAVKKIFAPPPPPPQPDYMRLIEILAKREEPKPAFSDSVVVSAIESLKEKNAGPSIFEQVRDIERLKGMLQKDENETTEEGSSNMNLLIESALKYLPSLLAQNKGNYQAAGRQAAEMPIVKNLVASDPQLAQIFFEKAKNKYGFDAAQQLARGFGLNMTAAPAVAAPEIEGDNADDEEEDNEEITGGENG